MELIYNAIWIFNNILVSTLIILIVHFLLEYLKENYDIDLFETHINKRNITDTDTLQHQDNVPHMNTNTVQCQDNAQNMDYELSKLINENIDKYEKINLVHAVIQQILTNHDLLRSRCLHNTVYNKFDEFEIYGIEIKNYKKIFDSILEKYN